MKPDWTVSATRLADPEWVRARIGGAAKLYGCARPEVLGTIWWYSLSSVLVAPAVESLAAAVSAGLVELSAAPASLASARSTQADSAAGRSANAPADPAAAPAPASLPGSTPADPAAADCSADAAPADPTATSPPDPTPADPAAADRSAAPAPAGPTAATPSAGLMLADPALDAMELDLVADGRFLGARSTRRLSGGPAELGAALAGTLGAAITTIAAVTGARERALGAIATDSIGNRLLWTPDPERALALAGPLVAAIGLDLPKPRFVHVGRTPAVRRASCCLIYEVGNPKCVSCPRQTPAEREARLRAALG